MEKWPYKEEEFRENWTKRCFPFLFSRSPPPTRERRAKIGEENCEENHKENMMKTRKWRGHVGELRKKNHTFSLSVWFVVSVLIEIPWRFFFFFYLNAAPKFNEFLPLYLILQGERNITEENRRRKFRQVWNSIKLRITSSMMLVSITTCALYSL